MSEYMKFYKKVDMSSVRMGEPVYKQVKMPMDDFIAACDHYGFVKERTCRQEERGWSTEGDHARVWLTCGHDCMVPTVQDLPNYCPDCGAKVVGE